MTKKLTVSAEEFAKMFGCSKVHIYRLIERNELKHIKLGRRYFIPQIVGLGEVRLERHARAGIR